MVVDSLGQEIRPGDYVIHCAVSHYAPIQRVGRVVSIKISWTPIVNVRQVMEPDWSRKYRPEMALAKSATQVTEPSTRLVVIPEYLVPADKKAMLSDLKIKLGE